MRGIDAGGDDGNRLCYTVAGKQLLRFMRRRDDCHCRIAEGAAEFACHVFGNDIAEQIDKVVTYMENLNA